MWKETATALRDWLKVRGELKTAALFSNLRGDAMTRSGFEYILDKHVRTASAKQPSLAKKRISPHSLRHSCAMSTLQATGDIRKVALWLGHANLASKAPRSISEPIPRRNWRPWRPWFHRPYDAVTSGRPISCWPCFEAKANTVMRRPGCRMEPISLPRLQQLRIFMDGAYLRKSTAPTATRMRVSGLTWIMPRRSTTPGSVRPTLRWRHL